MRTKWFADNASEKETMYGWRVGFDMAPNDLVTIRAKVWGIRTDSGLYIRPETARAFAKALLKMLDSRKG